MIYLDHAATSFPKPKAVVRAVQNAMNCCAGYGRSEHQAAVVSAEIVYRCRQELAQFFCATDEKHVAFAMNATMALNEAIHALVPQGSRVCVSGYEHNAVIRPLIERKCKLDIANVKETGSLLEAWETQIRKKPVCVLVNHASNVFGYIQPIKEIGILCAKYGVPLIVDASQSAGICDINISEIQNCAAVCTAGHKGLQGPQGTGVLIFTDLLPRKAFISGGTGSYSALWHQPEEIPDIFESGTPNLPGIAGLLESVKMIRTREELSVLRQERRLMERLQRKIEEINGLHVIDHAWDYGKLAVLSVIPDGIPCGVIGERLAESGVCIRSGLHCSPLAHKTEGTIDTGTIRFSVGISNSEQEIDTAAEILRTLMNTF